MIQDRTTFIIGAGSTLDLDLPQGIVRHSITNITNEVCKPYINIFNDMKPTDLVQEIYNRLMEVYPAVKKKIADETSKPNINFEHIFHVLEMLYSYNWIWNGQCNNPRMFPVFAPFTNPNISFDGRILHSIMGDFILRIMDIIHPYDEYFRSSPTSNSWYKAFYNRFQTNSDYFILNYDTTIENSILEYEDGFEDDGKQNVFQRFNPRRLFDNSNKLSTINHLHGCINYHFSSYKDSNEDVYSYLSHDLYKYPDYKTVRDLMIGRSQSDPTNQSGETYHSAPIITGLRKTDKLNCIPFDFYHANLANCITRNHKLVINGYGFGDLYCNQLIERMNFLHGDRKRIVVIDKWDIPKGDRLHGGWWLNDSLGRFLCRAAECGTFDGVVEQLYNNEKKSGALYSDNKCLLVLPKGFKHAASCLDEIECFLSS